MKNILCILTIALTLVIFSAVARAQTGTRAWTWNLSWMDNSDNEEGFIVYKNGAKLGQVGANVTNLSDVFTAAWGEQDCYQVSAFNHVNADGTGDLQESAKSAQACGTVPVLTQPVPAAPSNPSLVPGQTSMLFKWQNNESSALVDHNEIQRVQATPPRTDYLTAPASADRFQDAGLKKNTLYTYAVRAEGPSAVSLWSPAVSARTKK